MNFKVRITQPQNFSLKWMTMAKVVIAGFALGSGFISGAHAQSALAKEEREVITRTNDFRVSQGLGIVTADPILAKVARDFACYMAETGNYGHNADGREPIDRARSGGWPAQGCVSENIAWNQGHSTSVQGELLTEGWVNSPGHRANMLKDGAHFTGVGVCTKSGNVYAVQLFGRKDWATLTIVNRSAKTLSFKYSYGKNSSKSGKIGGANGG